VLSTVRFFKDEYLLKLKKSADGNTHPNESSSVTVVKEA
jgi:hypothetical protein